MDELTERQKFILGLVIRNEIEKDKRIGKDKGMGGSEFLVDYYKLNISSATVRNELAALTSMGYLHQPLKTDGIFRSSAGRVPTEEGYRYFVRQLIGNTELPVDIKRTISHQFYQVGPDLDRWMRLAASILAHQSQAASLVTAPRPEQHKFKHLELISTHGRQILLVLVLTGGEVHQQMLALAEPVSQEQLSSAAQHLNKLCDGLDIEMLSDILEQLTAFEQDVLRLIIEDIHHQGTAVTGEVYHDGLSHFIGDADFGEIEVARRALRIFEERPLLEDLLNRTVVNSEMGGVQVLIGGEGTWEELREFSMVLARYGAPGLATGTIGVLGPIRMAYWRNISTVRFMADILSEMVTGMHSD